LRPIVQQRFIFDHKEKTMKAIMQALPSIVALWRDTEGQDLVEYSLLLAFVALMLVSILTSMKTNLTTILTKISSALSSAAAVS
jgi:Flp pilus assembly pilin Flp